MSDDLQAESAKLAKSWMQHNEQMLRDYLVAGVEDPRLNVQSVLSRHFLVVHLFGNRFEQLLEQELRFAIAMNWARHVLSQAGSTHDLAAVRHALVAGADDAEGIAVPRYVSTTWGSLPSTVAGVTIPNYLDLWLHAARNNPAATEPEPQILETFQRLWAEVLRSEPPPPPLAVLELACGSANDYRFLDAFGLARFLHYTGLDLCEKNIRNAQSMFPHARFRVGNALDIEASSHAFDCCLVQDLFEHLSIPALRRAAAETARVTRNGLCLGFFNMDEREEHLVRPLEDYHWNTLSAPRIRELFEAEGFQVQFVHIDTLLQWRWGCPDTHNKNAYTLLAERRKGE